MNKLKNIFISFAVFVSFASAQTVINPGQIGGCPPSKNCVLITPAGKPATWALLDEGSIKLTTTPSDPFSLTFSAFAPSLESLTSRVTTLEGKVAELQAQQPVSEVIVATTAGQTFRPSSAPRWGFIKVTRNGVSQSVTFDYVIMSDGTIQFTTQVYNGVPVILPLSGEIIRLEYWK